MEQAAPGFCSTEPPLPGEQLTAVYCVVCGLCPAAMARTYALASTCPTFSWSSPCQVGKLVEYFETRVWHEMTHCSGMYAVLQLTALSLNSIIL
jgi:hypothetical protein